VSTESYDVAVIGAGRSVALLDAYGAANSRASSGDGSRVLRMGYGPHEIYTRWAMRSRQLWMELFEQGKQPDLFEQTGVLWTPPPGDPAAAETQATLQKCGVPFEALSPAELQARFPQIRFSSERMGIFEPESGALLARRAVRAVVEEAIRNGVDYFREAVLAPERGQVRTKAGQALRADDFVYACGP